MEILPQAIRTIGIKLYLGMERGTYIQADMSKLTQRKRWELRRAGGVRAIG